MILVEANEKQLSKWDEFIDNSINGTIFHKRRFLSYHGNKFAGKERFLVFLNGTSVYAQICLSIDENEDGRLITRSPYGASYGGVVFLAIPSYKEGKEIARLLIEYLCTNKVETCFITHPIQCCNKYSLDTFYFNLLENGFRSINRDISSVMVIEEKTIKEQLNSAVRWKIKSALNKGIVINDNPELEKVYKVLEEEQKSKFNKSPTHSYDEFCLLHKLFPKKIRSFSVEYEGITIAGMTCFAINKYVNSSFYLCIDEKYSYLNALRPLVMRGLEYTQTIGYKYFDFGTSSLNMRAHENVFDFKEDFTKVGMFRETLRWDKNA